MRLRGPVRAPHATATPRWFAVAAVAFCALGCSGSIKDPESRTAAEYVIERGGRVQLAGQTELIRRVDQIPETGFAIHRIDFNDTPIDDAVIKGLPGLKALQSLGLYRTAVTDAGLADLGRFRNLKELELSYTAVTDEGLSALTKLSKLERLFLYGTRVTSTGVETYRQAAPGVAVYHDPFTAPAGTATQGGAHAAESSQSRPATSARRAFR